MKNKEKAEFLNFDLEANNDNSKTAELDLLLLNKKNQMNINNLRRNRNLRNRRLQAYITNDVWLELQNWKHLNNIKKDSEAIELLIKIGLKNNGN